MYSYLLQKTKNKILQIINTIPYVRYQAELNYQAEVEKYIPHLASISKNDQEIVEKIRQEGVFITSLADLGIASTPKFIQAAQNLIPQIPTSASEDNQEFVIHASSQQIMAYPIIFLWGLEKRLINIIENFFGLPVAYHGVYFRRDIANKLEKGSRVWHIDKEARKILKIIVYLHDIDESQGPFQYIHPALSSEISKSLRYKSGYICDQIMQKVTHCSNYKSCIGLAGTVVFAATHSIFHRGKIPVTSDRFSIFFDYTPRLKEHSFYSASSLQDKDLALLAKNLPEAQKKCIFR
ncbi:2OG-Fe(II) oxygenase [Anabaena sp. UHCC 0451]|uniref:2OG-Fe(II) oxygenase n=1 Tax=Anabaena sp. UHCC 0451 TaxID=2055235 RepID=UPI002B204A21|nr:2OG-Fe(II) oxygenase [Anabaena sp. UHCC 0451]MEA5577349.1 2OG-Fe(II) oxygenase [Anabaena sp. UHCC 0451]